jgi:hypothetical protein
VDWSVAQAFRAELQRDAEELAARLSRIRACILKFDEFMEQEGSPDSRQFTETAPVDCTGAGQEHLAARAEQAAVRNRYRRDRRTRVDRIAQILRHAGIPLTTRDIVLSLINEGDRPTGISAKNYSKTVDSALRSGVVSGHFRKVGEATWSLSE